MKAKAACEAADLPYEQWRDIPGFFGRYQVSSEGRVRRVWPKSGKVTFMQPYTCKRAKAANSETLRVHLSLPNGQRVERPVMKLVADVFLNVPKGKHAVHRNGVRSDNSVSNIVLMSAQELGKKYGACSSRRTVVKVDSAGEVLECYSSAREAARNNFVSYQTVMDRCNGKVKKEFALDGCSYRWDDRL